MIDLSVFKEPRGFIKVVQFIFVICAFACACDFRGDINLTAQCPKSTVTPPPTTYVTGPPTSPDLSTTPALLMELPTTPKPSVAPLPLSESSSEPLIKDQGGKNVSYSESGAPVFEDGPSTSSPGKRVSPTPEALFRSGEEALEASPETPVTEALPETVQFKTTIKYPFKLEKFTASGKDCNNSDVTMTIEGNYSSPASFYVFVGVSAFIYTMMAVALYTYFKEHYEMEWVPVVDLGIHFAFTIMWFAGSIAWAVAITSIKNEVKLNSLMAANPSICPDDVNCTLDGIKWQLLDFSVVFGFVNFLLYLGNLWFIFKETTFFAKKAHSTIS